MKTKINLFLILLFVTCFYAFGQENGENEFNSKFIQNEKGGEVIYWGNKRYFVVKLFGGKVETTEIVNSKVPKNQHFIEVDQKIIQTSIIPIPKNVIDNYDLKNLSLEQQQSILEGYMNYEIEYITKDLKVNIFEAQMKPEIIKSKKYILWRYKMTENNKFEDNEGESVVGQIHISTICFDQILNVNIPILKKYSPNELTRILTKIGKNIKLIETNYIK
jgi:hypothetical protein